MGNENVKYIVEFDGNDGTGKTYTIKVLSKVFPNCIFIDRGLFSKATLLSDENDEMYKYIDDNIDMNRIYIILDDYPEHCQMLIKRRGDSIEEKYHTIEDLEYYRKQFTNLYGYCCKKNYDNVYLVTRLLPDHVQVMIDIIKKFTNFNKENNNE